MLKTLHITNFQSHKDSILEFSPGVNVIIGKSDSGKTAITRALRWLTFNRPSGDSICSYWAGKESTSVELDTTEGNFFSRNKEGSDGTYVLNKTEFKAFKTDVPKEITEALNINEICLQQQLDAPYLLSDTPGEVAQHFNKIAHLDAIDIGSKNVQSWINALTATIGKEAVKDKPATGLIKRLQDAQEEFAVYDFLDKMEADLEVLESLETKLSQSANAINKLQELQQTIVQKKDRIEEESEVLSMEGSVVSILKNIEASQALQKQIDQLNALKRDIDVTKQKINSAKVLMEGESKVKMVLIAITAFDTTATEHAELESFIYNFKRTKVKIKTDAEALTALEQKFHDEMPNECPLCGNKIKKI